MKITEIRSKLDEMYALTEADDFKNNDDTTFEVEDLQELFKEKVLEMDEAVGRLEVEEKNAPNLSKDQIKTLGNRVYTILQIMELNTVATNSISVIREGEDVKTYALLAQELLSAQWNIFQKIQEDLDDVASILINADEDVK